MSEQKQLLQIVESSFEAEVNAFKPGNVSIYSDGHGMQVDDFLRSAKLSSPILVNTELSFGERVYDSVKITMDNIGCNTNLGMLLLFTPLIFAAQQNQMHEKSLSETLLNHIKQLNQDDAERIFQAIAYANPGGLGESQQYDVTQKIEPEQTVSLYSAMKFASAWDRVAHQYAYGFEDVINIGLPAIKYFVQCWNSVEYALVACYLTFLSAFPDSHIQRKYGDAVATEIQKHGESLAAKLLVQTKPESFKDELEEFDQQLKYKKINPGTSADLTASSYLLYQLLEAN